VREGVEAFCVLMVTGFGFPLCKYTLPEKELLPPVEWS